MRPTRMKINESSPTLEAETFENELIENMIEVEDYLWHEDAERVQNAINVIREFKDSLSDAGLLL